MSAKFIKFEKFLYKPGTLKQSYKNLIENVPKKYLFSRAYYLNYTRYLLIKYGDINKELSPKSYKEERNTILNEIIINFLKLKFGVGLNHYKKISLLNDVFSKLESSREKNINVVSDFIYLK